MKSALRLAFIVCAVFIVASQVRFSLATLEARNTFLYIPFQLKPCTNTIESRGQSAQRAVRLGDELVAVNGRPLTGMAVYRQELRSAGRYLDSVNRLPPSDVVEALSKWPFRVTIRTGTAEARTVDIYFAHCTCGSLEMSQVVWYCLVPPVACVAVGLFVVAIRLQSPLAWLFLAIMVCLSVIPIVPEWSDQWSQVADPREWRDWFRVPALAYQAFFGASWPAWLILFAVYCFRRNVNSTTAWWAVTPILVVASLETLIAIGSSEYFRAVVPLHNALEASSNGVSIVTFFCMAAAVQSFGKRWALVSAMLAACAATVLCWPAHIPQFQANRMYDNLIDYRSPKVVGACLTAAVLLVVVVWAGRALAASAKPRADMIGGLLAIVSVLLLLVPFFYSALSSVAALWPMPFVPQCVVASLFVGMLASAWMVLLRNRADPSPA
jgi:hypothetical protein